MIGGCYATFGGLLSPEGAAEIFGDPSTISAGAFRPEGTAIEVDGGYRVTGRWSLGSGSSHANWFIAGCVVVREGKPVQTTSGAPLMREVFMPASAVQVVDTWNSTGLRGTASHDYTVDNVFVPSSRTLWFQDPPTCDRSLYRMPPIAMFATFISAVPLGIARHAIDAFVALARGKTLAMGTGVVADRPVAQATVGRAHALVSAGHAYVRGALENLWSRVDAGHAPTLADRGALWTAATHAAHSGLEAIQLLLRRRRSRCRLRALPARPLLARRADCRAARRAAAKQLRARGTTHPGRRPAPRLDDGLPRRRLGRDEGHRDTIASRREDLRLRP